MSNKYFGMTNAERQKSERRKQVAREYAEAIEHRRRQKETEAIRAEAEAKRREQQVTVKEHIKRIHAYRQNATAQYREIVVDWMDEKLREVDADQRLTEMGKSEKKAVIRASARKRALDFAKAVYNFRDKEIADVRAKASKVLDKLTDKADELTLSRFNTALADLKTDMMLNPNASMNAAKLKDFMGKIDNAHCAELLRGELAGLLGMVGTTVGEERSFLSRAVDSLRDRFVTPEQREALEAVEQVAMMEQGSMFSLIVGEHMDNNVGRGMSNAIHSVERLNAALENGGEGMLSDDEDFVAKVHAAGNNNNSGASE